MHIDLAGKTALVTGSTRGIGFGAALGLAESGARVVVHGRTKDGVEAAIARIREAVPGAVPPTGVAADLGTAAGCAAIVAAVPGCDILVNNAGIFAVQDFFEAPDSAWQAFYDVNVMAGVRLSRAFLPGMAARGWGRVLFISSESALNIPVDMIHYGVTKTAVMALARGLAKRMAGTGVTVNSVLPGPTLTEGMEAMLQKAGMAPGQSLAEAGRAFVLANRPSSIIRRPARVEEVANMIVYLCSPQASATTGAALRVDGGVVDSL